LIASRSDSIAVYPCSLLSRKEPFWPVGESDPAFHAG
jgi:hypothetical protein